MKPHKWRQRLLNFFGAKKSTEAGPIIVTFTGGMGAQILSAAAYFYLKKKQHEVTADFSYFDAAPRMAVEGKEGDCSHWGWQLDPFNLSPSDFLSHSKSWSKSNLNENFLHDGAKKLELGLTGLRDPEIQRKFVCDQNVNHLFPANSNEGYLCLHIRRGDYVNVASHVLDDLVFSSIAKKFIGLTKLIVVVSDSSIPWPLKQELEAMFPHAAFLDNVDAITSHLVMRGARILVCSNSQFSLVAAMLNPKAIKLIPKQWFASDQYYIEHPIHEMSSFEYLE